MNIEFADAKSEINCILSFYRYTVGVTYNAGGRQDLVIEDARWDDAGSEVVVVGLPYSDITGGPVFGAAPIEVPVSSIKEFYIY